MSSKKANRKLSRKCAAVPPPSLEVKAGVISWVGTNQDVQLKNQSYAALKCFNRYYVGKMALVILFGLFCEVKNKIKSY